MTVIEKEVTFELFSYLVTNDVLGKHNEGWKWLIV